MSETPAADAKPAEGEKKKEKAPGSPNKLLIIMAAANFLGVFGLGGFIVYDKLSSSHASAQAGKADTKGGEHGGGHGEEKAEEGEHGGGEEKAEGHGEKKEEGGHGEKKEEGGHGEKKAEGGHGGGAAEGEMASDNSAGPLLALEPFVTNLAEPDADRYLKATIQLRISNEAAKAEVEAQLVPVRAQVLMYLSNLTVADLAGDKRRALANSVKRIANEAMPSSRIRAVYFTDLVVQ